MRPLRHLRRRDDGASAVEYGLLVAAIAGVIVVILLALGQHVYDLFDHTCKSVAEKAAPSSTCE